MWGLFLNPQSVNSPESSLLSAVGGKSPMLGFAAPQLFSLPQVGLRSRIFSTAAALASCSLRKEALNLAYRVHVGSPLLDDGGLAKNHSGDEHILSREP